jgi:hypothetical protein
VPRQGRRTILLTAPGSSRLPALSGSARKRIAMAHVMAILALSNFRRARIDRCPGYAGYHHCVTAASFCDNRPILAPGRRGRRCATPCSGRRDHCLRWVSRIPGCDTLPAGLRWILAAILAGASALYCLSSRWGQALVQKLGKFMHISEDRLRSTERRFQTHGPWFIIIGRHIPGMRVPITVFCGIARVRYRLFLPARLSRSSSGSPFGWSSARILVRKQCTCCTVVTGTRSLFPGDYAGAVLIVRTVMRFRTMPEVH